MILAEQTCQPIKAGTAPLSREERTALLPQIPLWSLKETELIREFKFRDFHQAMAFVNKTADTANDQDHHPDIFISYNKVRLSFTTHKIHGLSLNDFISASKVDLLAGQ